ncbi:hypothetical protein J2Z23_004190 [Lederbergia galactosidilyticus]|uniref:hypothetical protein n=1 Tax=Lederbergia galactosidilytica TaxID=217031 RepID=UPI001AEB8878|nr:hypothetical protein [Lederbergia galactosidilytica]MBP1917205.1 hypothetical protein [Lederbergia galactosidilytica]
MHELKYKIGQQVKYRNKWFIVLNIRMDALNEQVDYLLKNDYTTGWINEEFIQEGRDERSLNERLKDIKGNWEYERCIKPEDIDWLISTADEYQNERFVRL